ncbi:MAG TPA: hypothetical protein VMX16_14530 [Terriglobia bacterium]|nr:hypothetical protein [Terriglobia bacterium]
MAAGTLVQLAQDLERLAYEEQYIRRRSMATSLAVFMEKHREVVSTVNKIERALSTEVRFNPAPLIGIDYPIDDALECVSGLVNQLEEIRCCAGQDVSRLPEKVGDFKRKLADFVDGPLPQVA